jgi:TPR repeat protein|tara:strand:+ start:138081 stop:138764 length:684 start_codon:yes stop_codon:yes gene_type:complete
MSNENTQENTTSLWSRLTSWAGGTWKPAIGAAAIGLFLSAGLFFASNMDPQDQDQDQQDTQSVEQTAQSVSAPTIRVDDENNPVLIADDVENEPETEVEEIDTVIDSPEEVLDLISSLGLTDVFADEVDRLGSDNVNVASQATKDIGHMLANGIDVGEDDTLANTFFQASYDMDGNTQAAHSVGYQALHGIGMDGADLELAEKMLSEANDNGHKLAAAHLDYLYQIK